MIYKVVLHASEEGYSVRCPGLPGCWSQGATEAEALENIRDAIRDYRRRSKIFGSGMMFARSRSNEIRAAPMIGSRRPAPSRVRKHTR